MSAGRLIYLMNVSLDGFVATPDGGLDWTGVDDELHAWFNGHARGIQASLYGRRLWDVMSAYWPTGEDDPDGTETTREFARIWNATPKVVFSSTLSEPPPGARIVHGEVRDVYAELRGEYHGDLEVGGPTLAGQFVRAGLVDEYRLVIHPVALGAGLPYWPVVDTPLRLRPVEQRRFASGVEMRAFVPV